MIRSIAFLSLVLTAGCVGNRILGTGDRCPCAPGWQCDAAANICVPGVTGETDGGGISSMGGAGGASGPSCKATCATPTGTVQALTSVQDVYAAVLGSWQICSDMADWTAAGAPSDVIGIEFGPASSALKSNGDTVGGDAYYLVQGPSGPVRGAGFDYQLAYSVEDETEVYAGYFQFNLFAGATLVAAGEVRYSPCPTELEIGFRAPSAGKSALASF